MRRERDDAEFMKIARQLMLDNIMVSTLAQRERKKERGREREKERGREGEREGKREMRAHAHAHALILAC